MKIRLTERFKKAYKKLQPEIQKKVDKAITLLLTNHKHPSIQVRKLESKPDKWYLRVDINHRLTFEIIGNGIYVLRNVGSHDKTLDNP